MKALLKAHKKWHKKRYPTSPWHFPGRKKIGGKPVSNEALTKLLERLYNQGRLKRKYTSHGLRAFYVLVRRSWGILDSQIAWEINQISGTQTLQTAYGGVPPHWIDGKGPKLPWLPKGKPAWSALMQKIV